MLGILLSQPEKTRFLPLVNKKSSKNRPEVKSPFASLNFFYLTKNFLLLKWGPEGKIRGKKIKVPVV